MALLRDSQWESGVRLIGSNPTRWGDKDRLAKLIPCYATRLRSQKFAPFCTRFGVFSFSFFFFGLIRTSLRDEDS